MTPKDKIRDPQPLTAKEEMTDWERAAFEAEQYDRADAENELEYYRNWD